MKKVFCIFLSLIALMSLSACEPETPGNPQKPDLEESSYLTFVSSGESSVSLVKVGEPSDISLEYSIDGKSWNPYTIGEAIYLLKNEVSFRAGETGNEVFSKGKDNYYQFKISGEVAAKGNIMSLLDRTCARNSVPSFAFNNLFSGCTSLTSAPELPAMELAEGCYAWMFAGCESLTNAPALPATKLAKSCYELMFLDCNSLTEAPALPATKLAEYCYYGMFNTCLKLRTVPELPATNLVVGCYSYMFKLCIVLNYVKALFIDEPSESTTAEWLEGVSFTGTFVKSKKATWDVWGASGIPYGWTVETDAGTSDDPQKPNPEEPSYLTFVSTGESTISLIKIGNPDPIILEYSTNGSTWTPYTIGGAITISNGENLMFRAGETGNECFSKFYVDYYQFEISGEVAAKGNIMSLLDRTCARNSLPSGAFCHLFKACQSLTSAPELPSMELAKYCYSGMFTGCTNLTKAPELPATVLAEGCYSTMFYGCTNLTKAPVLPATEMAEYCYGKMFRYCTSLTEAPELPATKLAEVCYGEMFEDCKTLTKAPELPATELESSCYASMFSYCTSLTKAPALPATKLASGCYNYMFSGCSSLTKAPELPATELAEWCYSHMFEGCTNLTKSPALPATKLVDYCYQIMFSGCTSLTEAPELLATELVKGCYEYMFEKCSNLNYVKALFTDEPSVSTTSDWLLGVAPTGTFVKSKNATWDVRGASGIPVGWTVESDAGTSDDPQKPNPEEELCLAFVSSGESTIALIKKGEPFEITLEYSVDGKVWEPYTIGKTVELADGGELMFRAGEQGNTKFSAGYEDYYRFIISGKVAAKGNVMSLLGRDLQNITLPYTAFVYLFAGCEGLISAPVLPATQLDVACYYGMFAGCVNLTKAPELPATELAKSCYWQMFSGCKSLTESPALPATELAMMCYYCMFQNCPSLAKAPALPAMKMAASCYLGMFYDCASLTKAPELPATELAQYCYKSMFDGCTNLTKAPELPATVLAEECYSNMFHGCASLTKAPELPAMELAEWCYSQMFERCTNLTKAPVLPATKLAEYCYTSMFYGCTNLNYVKALFTDEPSDATNYWLFDVSPTGMFVKSKEAKWDVRGESGIPEGWTVVTE